MLINCMLIFPVIIFFLLIATLVTALFASAAPWLPTRRRDLGRVLRLAGISPGERFYDLGCGDARIIIGAAASGAVAVGYDISLLPYLMAKIRLWKERSPAKIYFKNFYRQNLRAADVVYLFLTPTAMPNVKKKFEAELKAGCRVVSYAFRIPGWTPTQIDKDEKGQTAYLYVR